MRKVLKRVSLFISFVSLARSSFIDQIVDSIVRTKRILTNPSSPFFFPSFLFFFYLTCGIRNMVRLNESQYAIISCCCCCCFFSLLPSNKLITSFINGGRRRRDNLVNDKDRCRILYKPLLVQIFVGGSMIAQKGGVAHTHRQITHSPTHSLTH